ncbi:MAG: hypothetical protein K1562_13400 [Candidatus Thiodiazotropha sp. (ex. Lucinisca nassula)]|nr:hypothetical protein [Candidatus Thiodiazotropha sp. (ex. Lucinisca nassula)]
MEAQAMTIKHMAPMLSLRIDRLPPVEYPTSEQIAKQIAKRRAALNLTPQQDNNREDGSGDCATAYKLRVKL